MTMMTHQLHHRNNNNNNNVSEKNTPATNGWSRILNAKGNIPPARSGAASVIVNQKLYIFGGYGGGGNVSNTMNSNSTSSSRSRNNNHQQQHHQHQQPRRLDDFYCYSFETNTWEEVMVLSKERPGCRENNGGTTAFGSSTNNMSTSSSTFFGNYNNDDDTQQRRRQQQQQQEIIYLFGGYNGNEWLNDLWMFDIQSKRWTCLQESSDDTTVKKDNLNAIISNKSAKTSISTKYIDDPKYFTTSSGVTTSSNESMMTISPPPPGIRFKSKRPSRRFGYVSVIHKNKLILFGGFNGTQWLNDLYDYNFHTNHWRQIEYTTTTNDNTSRILPSKRSCPAWAKDDTHIYILGGYDGMERKDDFFACDLETYTWKEMPVLVPANNTHIGSSTNSSSNNNNNQQKYKPPSPRYFHSCCLYERKLYVYGGYSGSERLSDMFIYDLDTCVWSEVTTLTGEGGRSDQGQNLRGDYHHPSGRSSLVAQVYKNYLYIFGGYNGEIVLNDFYKFRLEKIDIPPSTLMTDMMKLLHNESMSDVTFLVEGQEIHANRALLAVRSDYFNVMLYTGNMKESMSTYEHVHAAAGGGVALSVRRTTKREPIQVKDVSYPVFLKVIEFLYTDTLQYDVPTNVIIPLLITSEKFMLNRLKCLCEDRIQKEICVDNAIRILGLGHCHNADGLKRIALESIVQHLRDTTIMLDLSELKSEPDLLIDIINEISKPSDETLSPPSV